MSGINAGLRAIHAYQEQHHLCDIQRHPWQAVFGAGFDAGIAHAQAAVTALVADKDAEIERLRRAAEPIYRWVHEEHAHARLGDAHHDPDCLLCEQIDTLYTALKGRPVERPS